jgi:hypothetical protein
MQSDFPEEHRFEAEAIAHSLLGADSARTTVTLQTASHTTGTCETLTLSSLTTNSGGTPPHLENPHSPGAEAGSQSPGLNNPSIAGRPRFLLLCVDTTRIGATGKYRTALSNIDVSTTTVWNDQLLFFNIQEEYYSKRPRSLLSMHTPKSLFFVQVSIQVSLQDPRR